ncbi:GerMN domain-containing protein [Tumebacillus sp. DT12]|uniref:GerMN domain-containing protein n=1 Tax=Tumebacillus lacus TaxID=2995335 RepID=A0ABT3X643_9BACL|nr:GerMN domain-containing protein [Tumebacillus lacus]MCX7571327.1 GerMN domain-containing protein [Tumebacillus lacus]
MRKKNLALVGVLAVSLLATGCSLTPEKTSSPTGPSQGAKQGEQAENVMPTTVYAVNQNGFVVPLNIKIGKTEGVAKATLQHMIKAGAGDAALTGTGLTNVLPKGTEIRGLVIDKGMARVDFSKEVLDYKTAEEERAIVDAVVWTLTSLPNVDKVQLLFDGHVKPTMKMGTPVADPISRESGINLQVQSEVNPTNATKLTLYFEGANDKGNFNYLVPVTRIVPNVKDQNMVDLTLAELAKGPNAAGLDPVVMPTMKPLKTDIKEKTATLDFGDDFQAATSTTAGASMIHSIVLSVAANSEVEQIQFTVNGQMPGLTDGFDLTKPVAVPKVVNEQQL